MILDIQQFMYNFFENSAFINDTFNVSFTSLKDAKCISKKGNQQHILSVNYF